MELGVFSRMTRKSLTSQVSLPRDRKAVVRGTSHAVGQSRVRCRSVGGTVHEKGDGEFDLAFLRGGY